MQINPIKDMGHIYITGNTIEHVADSNMLSQNTAVKEKIINAINDAKQQLEEIEYVSKGVADTTNMINDFIDENYVKYEELYEGGSPLVREFVHTVTITYHIGTNELDTYTERTETGADYKERAQEFFDRIKNDARITSSSIIEVPFESTTVVVDDNTQITTETNKVVVTVEYNS